MNSLRPFTFLLIIVFHLFTGLVTAQGDEESLFNKNQLSASDCKTFKTGKFKMSDELTGETLIVRTKKYQIEENEKFDMKLKLKIEWIGDCTYTLTPIEDLNNPEKKDFGNHIITCQILELTDSGYILATTSNIYDGEEVFEVIRND